MTATWLVCAPAAAFGAPVRVLYAGSLAALMERSVGPAFDKAGGTPDERFEGFAGGSQALVNQMKAGLRPADVFVSANPALNEALGPRVRWFMVFARSPLVIGYAAGSRFAPLFAREPWYDVLRTPGVRIGRTDPALDPKGVLTVKLLDRAEEADHQPGLEKAVLAASEILPEETLVGRLQSGELDAGFFYATETADLHIPAVRLPSEVALDARYSATVLADAPNPAGGARFVAFLLGPEGEALMRAHGLEVTTPALSGDASSVPAPVRAALIREK